MTTVLSDKSTGNFWAYAGWGAHGGYITTNVRTTTTLDTIGTKVTAVKYMRSIYILFKGVGMRPYASQTPYFDDIDVSKWTAPLTETQYDEFVKQVENSGYVFDESNTLDTREKAWKANHGLTIKADREGKIFGVFRIPPSTFECGTTILKMVDEYKNTSESTFTSSGELTTTYNKITTNVKVTLSDPVGQSFRIDLPNDVQGCYITSIGLWFKTISKTSNLYLEIRNMSDGGMIGSERIAVVAINPRATMEKDGYEVKTSEVGADADMTKIPLPSPIYLDNKTSYAFVLRTNSTEYNVWGARMGEGRYDKDEAVATNPYIGCMFKSANNETWEVDEMADLKFRIYRAKFKTNPTTGGVDATIRSAVLPPLSRTAFRSYIQTFDGTRYYRVFAINHGLYVGSKVIVKLNTTGTTVNGIPTWAVEGKKSIDGDYVPLTVVAIDSTSFTVSIDNDLDNLEFTGTGGILGETETILGKEKTTHYAWFNSITYYPNISTDIIYLNQVKTEFTGTTIKNELYPTYLTNLGNATDGEEDKYEIIENTEIQLKEKIAFPSYPELTERLKYARYPSYIITTLHSDNDYMSPQINLDGMALITAGINFNNPARDIKDTYGNDIIKYNPKGDISLKDCFINYMAVAEAGRLMSNALMKYVTAPVTLEKDTSSLKVIFAGNVSKDNYISVFYRTLTSAENCDISEKDWINIKYNSIYRYATEVDEYYDYEYEVKSLQPFNKFQVKLVCWGDDKAVPVKIKDFRAVALAK